MEDIIIIVDMRRKAQPTLEEQIQERILNLSDDATTFLMQGLGKWNKHKVVKEYNEKNIGELVVYGNSMGWDVDLNIEVGHDYHLVGEYTEVHKVDTYRIYGIHEEVDEWKNLLNLESLAKEIAKSKKMQIFLNYVEYFFGKS